MAVENEDIEHDVLLDRRGDVWRRRAVRAALALVVLGLLGAGTTFGWLLRGWLPSGGVGVTTTEVVVNRPVQVDGQTMTDGILPNVLGLDESEARQAYLDAGVDAERLEVTRVPFVGAPGSVVEQQPPAASRVPRSGTATRLAVATPATMPELKGLAADDARDRLDEIGVSVTTDVRFDESVAPGQVARSEPPAGSAATPQATLYVSEAASSVDLAVLEPVTSDCRVGDATVRGTDATGAVLCDVGETPVSAEYAINDKVSGFETRLALSDGHPGGARARLVVSVDGKRVGTFTTAGAPVDVRVRVPGGEALRLELTGAGDALATTVLTDTVLVGARSGIDELTP